MLDAAIVALEREFDARNGGWGGAPKFPQPMTIEFLLRMYVRTADERPLAMARRTLDAMAAGGIYDHLGGGFARYATDAVWLVPHFEKMLYDNAQLARVYIARLAADARAALSRGRRGDARLRRCASCAQPDGGFASSLDADTDGEEGATYVWSKAEIDSVLGPDAAAFDAAYDVTANGNWEGTQRSCAVSRQRETRFDWRMRGRGCSRCAIDGRSRPRRQGAHRLERADDRGVGRGRSRLSRAGLGVAGAETAADLLLTNVARRRRPPARSWKDGRALHSGVLEDYANLADGLLALYQATFDERWFVAARELARRDPGALRGSGRWLLRHGRRPRGAHRAAQGPAGQRGAVWERDGSDRALQKLAALTGESRYADAAAGSAGAGRLRSRIATQRRSRSG